jgi:predicted DNA-binding transcriptional regulator AlpA
MAMNESTGKKPYLDIAELTARAGLSRATVWRLKRDGKIPFFQPSGKGGRVMFPEDAIECAFSCESPDAVIPDSVTSEKLPGPQPSWMAPTKQHQ